MTDSDVTAVLDRAVDALSPRDPDPVGAVIRRVRARRRRIIASVCAVVLLAAGGGVAGVLTTGQGSVRTVPPASGGDSAQVRQVTAWTGETATLQGVTVPVPEGWRVEHPGPSTEGHSCKAQDRTVYVAEPGTDWFPCGSSKGITYVTLSAADQVYGDGSRLLARDPSGQPVWTDIPADQPGYATLGFVWSQVEARIDGMSPADAREYLGQVRAEPVGPLRTSLTMPRHLASASFVDYDGPNDSTGAPSNGTDLRGAISALVRAPSTAGLRCLPRPDTMTVALLDVGSDQRHDGTPADDPTSVTFDRTGACGQAFDTVGGLVEIDGQALHELLQGHSLNPPVVPSYPEPTEPGPAGSGSPPAR